MVTSSVTAHNVVVAEHPDLAELLHLPYHFSRQQEQAPDEGPFYPNPIYDFADGVLCSKVTHQTAQWVHGPQRVLHPLIRTGTRGSGHFKQASWSEALDLIYARVSNAIAQYGAQSVMPLNYAGPHGILAGDSMSMRFFHKLGATQLYRGAMCGAVRREAWVGTYGAVPGIGPEAASGAQLNVVWGNNATVTNLHLVKGITQSRRAGGRLAVIDPLRTRIAELADLHIAPLPGTDVLLGFALVALAARLVR
jgi:anaerobic selenocysteine-containing dehydrogenase